MNIRVIQYYSVFMVIAFSRSVLASEPLVGPAEFAVAGSSSCTMIYSTEDKELRQQQPRSSLVFDLEWSGECAVKREGRKLLATQKIRYSEMTRLLDKESKEETFELVLAEDGSLQYPEPLPFSMSYFPVAVMPYELFGTGLGITEAYVVFKPQDYRVECRWFPSRATIGDRLTVRGPMLTYDRDNEIYGTGVMERVILNKRLIESASEWYAVISIDEVRRHKEILDAIPRRHMADVLMSQGLRFQTKASAKEHSLK